MFLIASPMKLICAALRSFVSKTSGAEGPSVPKYHLRIIITISKRTARPLHRREIVRPHLLKRNPFITSREVRRIALVVLIHILPCPNHIIVLRRHLPAPCSALESRFVRDPGSTRGERETRALSLDHCNADGQSDDDYGCYGRSHDYELLQ